MEIIRFNQPKLSIIVPIYNVAEYIEETLSNVLSQTFHDYELILVDDGSTDGSGEICDAFAMQDERIVVIHQKNAGVSAARNAGVSAAKGKYIGFVDSDDLIEPKMFSVLVEIANCNGADVVQCRHNRLDVVQNISGSGVERVINGKQFVREMFSYRGGEYTNQVALWSKIYRRELFVNVHFPEGRTYEDEQETYKLCLFAEKIVQIPDELYHYVRRENSIITGISAKKMIDKQLALMDRMYYLSAQMPELREKCVSTFVGYSKGIMCRLYEAKDDENLQEAIGYVVQNQKQIAPHLNKYDRFYLPLLGNSMARNWILANDFQPVQNVLAKLKGIKQ